MSKIRIIQFDASVRNNKVGIGIYDRTDEISIVKTIKYHKGINKKMMNSKNAETLALISTLQYIQERNIQKARLFTDNLYLFEEGISDYLQEKYIPNVKITLHWIPRELNKDADKLSKEGSIITHNIDNSAVKQISNNGKNLKEMFREYPKEERLKFLETLAKKPSETGVIHSLRNNNPLKRNGSNFLKICLSVLDRKDYECLNTYFNKLTKAQRKKARYTSSNLEIEIEKRK